MKTAEFAGAIGLLFGSSQREVWDGELMRSVGTGLAPENEFGKNRWRLNGHTAASRRSPLSLSGTAPSKEWFVVARDHHSRARRGNQRP